MSEKTVCDLCRSDSVGKLKKTYSTMLACLLPLSAIMSAVE